MSADLRMLLTGSIDQASDTADRGILHDIGGAHLRTRFFLDIRADPYEVQ